MCDKSKTSRIAVPAEDTGAIDNALGSITAPYCDITGWQPCLPSRSLKSYISHYVSFHRAGQPDSAAKTHPTADVYMIFQCNPNGCRSVFVGPRTFSRECEYTVDGYDYFVVSLTCKDSYLFLPTDQNEFLNKSYNLQDVLPKWCGNLTEQICSLANINDKVNLFETFLRRYLARPENEPGEYEHFATKLSTLNNYEDCFGYINSLGYSERHLRRLFVRYTGVGPKKFARILRCKEALTRMTLHPQASLTSLAHNLDYHDQSHFIHEFKSFYNLTPSEFIEQFVER